MVKSDAVAGSNMIVSIGSNVTLVDGVLGVGQRGADLGDAGGVAGLIFLGGVVLGVLGKVAECAGFLDVLDDLLGLLTLEIGEFFLELLATLGSQYDLACIHASNSSCTSCAE